MNIYLIRHAEPNYETDNLTPTGLIQAQRLADYLADVQFTHLYCSPLGRARATLTPALATQRAEPITLDWLRELEAQLPDGRWCWNVTLADLFERPGLARQIESFMADQQTRLLARWDSLLAGHGYQREGLLYHLPRASRQKPIAAMFCHAGLITTLLAGLFQLPLAATYARLKYPPTGITHLQISHHDGFADLRLVSYAARPHLDLRAQLDLQDSAYLG
ncbi:MAG: histidine phosphatase family protein [Planctomycetota bacterium]